jgi:putative drug exporter of the RND superfamily
VTADDTSASTTPGPSRARRIAALPCGRRTKYVVLIFWVIVIGLTGSLAGKLMGAEKNDASAYLPASAESTQELNLQSKFVVKNLNPAVVVYTRPSGLTPADLRKAAADARRFAALPQVHGRVTGPIPSADHQAMQTIVGSSLGFNSDIEGFINNLKATAARGDPGLTVHIAGPAASAADQVKIFKGIDSTLLYATLAVIIVLLLLTYRSPILWLLPIISAAVSLTVAQAVIYLLTQHGLVVNGQSGGILVVLVLGASTDYALLLIARYREELRRHEDRHEAMAIALRRAGPAIIASAGTVIAGMLCLLVAQSADISGLGPVAAIGIAVGLLAMITLLPALLVIVGRWVFWPLRPRYGSAEPTTRGFWAGVGRRLASRSVALPARSLPSRWWRSTSPVEPVSRSPSSATPPPHPSCAPRSTAPTASPPCPGRPSRMAWSSCKEPWPASPTARPRPPRWTGSGQPFTPSRVRMPRSAAVPPSTPMWSATPPTTET